jgi:hypothetical protein
MTEHPLPWKVEPLSRMVRDANDEPIALLSDEATARLIADAVNNREMVSVCHAALAELDQTRWNMSGGSGEPVASMKEWAETVEGRTFARVQRARELLIGLTKEGQHG